MIEVVVLGSGTPSPDPGRAGSALAVVAGGDWVLVDCGRAATQRAIDAGLDLTSVVAVAITHHHSDHLSDLATFAIARWVAGASTPLTVVAPSGPSAVFARRCLDAFSDQAFHAQAPEAAGPRPAIDVREFEAGRDVTLALSSGAWRISSVLVDHHPIEPAVGYLVEHDRVRVAISGDTAACNGIRGLARGVDVLVHEALLTSRVPTQLLAWNAAATAVGELAAESGVRTLLLTHLIPAPTSTEDECSYVEDVRAGGFAGTVMVAQDLLRVPTKFTHAPVAGVPSGSDS